MGVRLVDWRTRCVSSCPAADADKAAVYLGIMKRVLAKGSAWLTTEAARVDGMLASPSVSKSKKSELGVKRHVMASFVPASATEEEL